MLNWTWFDGVTDLDSIRIPDTILLQTTFHHSTVGWHPGSVKSMVMPGRPILVPLRIDGDHFTHVDHNLNDDLVILRVTNGIAASFLQVSAEVDATAEHPIFRLVKTIFLDQLSIAPGGAMVHDVTSIIYWLRVDQWVYPRGQVKVIFSPLVRHVGVSITVGKYSRLQNDVEKLNIFSITITFYSAVHIYSIFSTKSSFKWIAFQFCNRN